MGKKTGNTKESVNYRTVKTCANCDNCDDIGVYEEVLTCNLLPPNDPLLFCRVEHDCICDLYEGNQQKSNATSHRGAACGASGVRRGGQPSRSNAPVGREED